MSPSMFSQLPNNLIMNIIKMNTIQEEKEKKIRKDIFSKCMNEINEVPYEYSRTYITEEMAKEFNIERRPHETSMTQVKIQMKMKMKMIINISSSSFYHNSYMSFSYFVQPDVS